ncbi:MAG TPA: cupin domain-containing protein [Polyangiaceae bacterium]
MSDSERFDAALLEALAQLEQPARAPSSALRARLLASVASPRGRLAPLYGALADLFDLGDAELATLFERAEDASAWASSQVPGVRLLHLAGGPRVALADNGLVRLEAGAPFPLHRHLGFERTLVLRGGYRDAASGKLYLAGDWHEMPAGTSHAYSALPGGELLLAVSIVEGVEVEGLGKLTPATG